MYGMVTALIVKPPSHNTDAYRVGATVVATL
jgi:hypothetical protein